MHNMTLRSDSDFFFGRLLIYCCLFTCSDRIAWIMFSSMQALILNQIPAHILPLDTVEGHEKNSKVTVSVISR